MSVKRYDPNYDAISPADDLAVEVANGMFVMASDYDTLAAANQRLREALATAKYRIEQGRVWNGTGWTLTGLHSHGQQQALDAIDTALTTANGKVEV
jgi:L-aminopeptidase/D-esterase-like protein